MTRTELEAEIGRLSGDKTNDRWPTDVIDLRLDAAQIAVQKYAKAVKTEASYTPAANSPYVTINANVIDILRATYTLPDGTIKTEKKGFKPISRWDLDFNRPNWPNEAAGEPQLWFLDASNQRVVLVPKPDSASAVANALNLIEIRQSTALSTGSSSSVPFDSNNLMVPFHRALAYWVVAENLRDNQDKDSLAKAKYFRSDDRSNPGLFEIELKQILSLFDVPEAVPAQVLFQPTGGRISGYGLARKENPLREAW